MSRGVKDLRELVVVSRLTFRDSGSESDDGRAGMITPFESLDITDRSNGSRSPDAYSHGSATPTPPSSADSGIGRRKKKRSKPKNYVSIKGYTGPKTAELHAFPKSRPLPAVGETYHNTANGVIKETIVVSSQKTESVHESTSEDHVRTDYSEIISYIDEEIIADWLERSNQNLKDLTAWCTDSNFVQFAQFWITEFGLERRCEILALEHSILLDELAVAFRPGLELGKVKGQDISELLSALLREYPKKLTMPIGVYLFLDYLDTFTSERALEYRTILSDVKLSTQNRDHIQLILASRSFMLINVWMAIVAFYKQVNDTPLTSTEHLTVHREKSEINYNRLLEAINSGHVEVVHYFLFSGKLSAGHVDSRQKTLLHIAIAANQPRVVEYLLKKWTGCMDVNRPCDTGNSPLHVAVNLGSYNIVRLLLNMPDIDVDKENEQCDCATPLLLAVLHGHADIVRMLLKSQANHKKSMGGQTPADIARDFGHEEILAILLEAG